MSESRPPDLSAPKRALLERRLREREGAVPRRGAAAGPLSFGQESMWTLDRLAPEAAVAYHVPRAYRVEGAIDLAALKTALDEVVARHEILRTTFHAAGNGAEQRVGAPRSVEIRTFDLTGAPASEREARARLLAVAEASARFDLERDPMLRPISITISERESILMLVSPHIASDDASRGVLLTELKACYEAALAGRTAELPPPSLQFLDFALWQRERGQDRAWDGALRHFRHRLDGAPVLLTLPTDRPRPPVRSFRGARIARRLESEDVAALSERARAEGATPFMAFLAGFAALLARHAAVTDLVVGIQVTGRSRPPLEPLIGYLSNTLPLRIDLSGDPTFGELVGRVRAAVLDAHENAELPFEKLVEELKPERSASRPPLFQALFTFGVRERSLELGGAQLTPFDVDRGTSKVDLSLDVTLADGEAELLLEYARDLFDAETTARMLGHLRRLLAGAAADFETPLSRLPLLTDPEKRQVLVEWNATRAHVPDAPLHRLVQAGGARSPDAIALRFDGRTLTHRELDARANRLANHLVSRGVGRGTLVGVALERSLETVVALLGVLKAGAAYVPLDPSHPDARLALVLDETRVPIVLTDRAHAPRFASDGREAVVLDAPDAAWRKAGDASPAVAVTPSDLAYVIFTSGSTGVPKGVEVTHGGLVNVLGSIARTLDAGPRDTLLAVTTLSFDIAALELFMPLLSGGCVEIAPRAVAADGRRLAELVASSGATVMQATPATWRMLLDAGWTASPGLKVLCGGEAWTRELAAVLLTRGVRLWNVYGPTETTVWSAIEPIDADGSGPIPIGRPLANTTFYVLDATLSPVPIGVPGELHIGGAGLARGYFHRPDLTAERFVPSPFTPGARLYKTGDLVRSRPDGRHEFLGRIDAQVKVRGFRIEPAEVEAALRAQPSVREAVVVAREERTGERRLVAYVVPAEGGVIADAELRRALAARLPDYMIPSVLVPLAALPLTPNGKVDRGALPDPGESAAARPFVEPSGPVEELVAEVLRDALEVPRLSTDDDFFALGGHSLSATRAVARLSDEFRLEIPARVLFENPSVSSLSAALSDLLLAGASPEELAEGEEAAGA